MDYPELTEEVDHRPKLEWDWDIEETNDQCDEDETPESQETQEPLNNKTEEK